MPDHPNRRPQDLPRGADPARGDLVDQLIDRLAPVVDDILARIGTADDPEASVPGDAPASTAEPVEFTTSQFIDLMLSDPVAAVAYRDAIDAWGEGERYAKMVVHGQVIPGALRQSPRVTWAGYAHGEPDEFAVPAWWRLAR